MDREWSPGKKSVYVLWRAALLLCAGACMGYLALRYAYGQYHWGVFEGYKSSGMLMALNILPAMWLVGIFYALTGRAWLAFLLGGSSTLSQSKQRLLREISNAIDESDFFCREMD